MDEREDFARRQAAMTSTWYEAVKQNHKDVDRYIKLRNDAYLGRWREAMRFVDSGSSILDIGGGNLFPMLVEYVASMRLNYHYIDIDPRAVEASRLLLSKFGLDPSQATCGFNDSFIYDDENFDSIFSSHCIEHSMNLGKTLTELNRMLKLGGNLLIAVPFGWEENPEHPYFFDFNQWIALVEDSGFEIRVAQIGREYPEEGCDLFIAARKVGPALVERRVYPDRYMKSDYNFVHFTDGSISYSPEATVANYGRGMHMRGDTWQISISRRGGMREILPVFHRHDWSGQIIVSNEFGDSSSDDLYSWFSYAGASRLTANSNPIFHSAQISCSGRSSCSRSTEGVFLGYMWN